MKTIFLLVIAVLIGVWLEKSGTISLPAAVIMTSAEHGIPTVVKGTCLHVKDTSIYICGG